MQSPSIYVDGNTDIDKLFKIQQPLIKYIIKQGCSYSIEYLV